MTPKVPLLIKNFVFRLIDTKYINGFRLEKKVFSTMIIIKLTLTMMVR